METLTSRELEIAELVAKGCRNKIIAKILIIAEATVKTHLCTIYTKLGITNLDYHDFDRRVLLTLMLMDNINRKGVKWKR